MANIDELEAEQRQMQKLKELRIQAGLAVKRWWWLGLVMAIVAEVALALYVRWKTVNDPNRCEAMTNFEYSPKGTDKVKAMDDAQVLNGLKTRTVLKRSASLLGLGANGAHQLEACTEIFQDNRNKNFYAVKISAPTKDEAIRRVNAFAEAAVNSYQDARREDLRVWRDAVVDQRKAEIAGMEREIDAKEREIDKLERMLVSSVADLEEKERELSKEESAFSTDLGLLHPIEEEIGLLQQQVAGKQEKLRLAEVMIGEGTSLIESLKAQFNGVDAAILDEADTLKNFTDKLAEDEEQIEKLSRIYTDENPRLKNYLDDRREVKARYDAFLARFGVKPDQQINLKRLDELVAQTRTAQRELGRVQTQRQALVAEIDRCNERLDSLRKMRPQYDGFKLKRDDLKRQRADLNREFEDLKSQRMGLADRRKGLQSMARSANDSELVARYLEKSVAKEFRQLESATVASEKKIFSKKKQMVIAGGGLAIGALLLLLAVLFELVSGKVRCAKELASMLDVTMLGVIDRNDDNLDDVFLHFNEAIAGRKSVFLAPLAGATVTGELISELTLRCTMAGLRTLVLEIRPAAECPDDPKATILTAVSYSGDHGVMPVVSADRLSVSELAMLEADLETLTTDFDLVVVNLSQPPKHGAIVMRQLAKQCDVTLAFAGLGKTPRREVRALIETGTELKRPTLLLGLARLLLLACVLPAFLGGCYFTRLTGNYEQYPDLVDVGDGAIDESRLTDAEARERIEFLKKLDAEPPEEFRINAGDQFNLVVYDHPDISGLTTVTPDGYIGIVFLGQVKVAGLTLGEAAKKIENGLSRYLKKPAIGLSPMTIASQTVTVVGGVSTPGIYQISSDMRLADLYAKAGGSGVRKIDGQDLDVADFSHSYLFREGYDGALPIDFERAINGGDRLHNVRLKKNDRIVIGTRTESFVTVIGHIRSPHTKLWNPNLNLMEVLTSAGWVEETYWSNVIIIRGGVSDPYLYKVNVDDILAGKRPNVRLAAGDIVYVPHDNISEYNVFIRKLLPTGQLFNLLCSPFTTWNNFETGRR